MICGVIHSIARHSSWVTAGLHLNHANKRTGIASNIEDALNTLDVILSPEEKVEIVRELEANLIKIASIFSEMVVELNLPAE